MKLRSALALGCALALLAACRTAPPRSSAPAPATEPSEELAGPRPTTPAPVAPARGNRRPTEAELAAIPDAVPRNEPRSLRGNPPFYNVLGKRYTVLATGEGYKERGVASWYGPTFHEKDTSIGESYDMYAMSAAHKTLPLPAYARVTNLANGRSIVVRVNDRGPFVGTRLIDLSYTAAWKLDMIKAGTAFVEVEALMPGSVGTVAGELNARQQIPAAVPPALFVQVGAFGVSANAERLATRLRDNGFANTVLLPPAGAGTLWRVRVGPVTKVEDYDRIVNRLSALGLDGRLAAD